MRKLLFLFFLTILPLAASADDVLIDGIWYSLSSSNGVNTACIKDVPDDCTGDIVIPESVTYKEVTYSVTSIENYAFDYCSSLTSVTIPNSVTSIGYGVFRDCCSLISINVVEGNIKYDSRENCNAIIETSSNSLIAGCKYSKIPNSVTCIGNEAFEFCSGLTSITIPEGVTSIEKSAFRYCVGLTAITIPGSVTNMGGSAFSYCKGLTSITILNGVTRIGIRAFEFCSSLTSITIPESVTSIDYSAFANCSSLTSVTCLASNPPKCFYSFGGEGEITLYVPAGCKEKYAAKEPWNQFKEIVEIEVEIDDSSLFPDCPEGEIRDAAIYLYHKGIVKGENGLLIADRDATRAEVAKVSLYGAYFGPDNVPTELATDNYPSVYEDLQDKSTYYYRPAKALLYLEYGDGVAPFDRNRLTFGPAENIARVNVLKVLMETFDIQPNVDGTNNPFPQDDNVVALATSNPVKMGYIRKAAELGIITQANETFRPYANCTRGETFLMLARIMQKIEAGEIDDPTPQNSDYFQPLNTTLATIGLGVSQQMGNFKHYTKTSFALPGIMPLTFSHMYNSYNTTLPSVFFGAKTVDNVEVTYQPLGDGWSHNYHSFITMIGSNSSDKNNDNRRAIVHWGGGAIDVYKSVDGKLTPESMGIYDDISIDENGVVIKSKSQIEYHFDNQKADGAYVLYLSSIKDRNGNTLTISYEDGKNGAKRIKTVSDGYRSLEFGYLENTDLLSEVKDVLNRCVKFEYFDNPQTGKKQLESFTDAEGNTTTYEYADLNHAGTSKLLSRIQLPKGNYIENEYDTNRRLSKTEKGLDGVPSTKTSISVTADYSGTASTQSQVDVERGLQQSSYHYTFNENNILTQMTGDKDLYMHSDYGNSDRPELPTAIQSNSTTISNINYDTKGNITDITISGDGELTYRMTYDGMNNLTSFTDPMNNTTEYSYDDKGNLTGVSAPEGVTASIAVNEKGLPTEITNAMSVKTEFDYNDYGNLVKATLPALGLTSEAEYDDASRLVNTKDALQRIRAYEYNKNDYMTKETDPMGHETQYGYDMNDNLITITNAKNGVTTLTYDNATDWLQSVEFAGAKKQYDYNKDGTLNTFTKPDGTILTYSYDELGRIVSDGVNTYDYDEKLRLSQVSDNNHSVQFTYDGFNRIVGTTDNDHSNSYGYDKNGNCTSINGVQYGYDGLNRLITVTFNEKTITYNYRKDSQLSSVSYPNGMTTEYEYDEVGRLTGKQTKLSNGTVVAGYSYTLDKVGNITEQTTQEPYNDIVLSSEEVSYSYNDGNRITKAGDISFEFDANGNTTKRGSDDYSWDVKDRLTNNGVADITYDPLGLIASYGDITFRTNPLGMGNVIYDSKSGAEYIYGNGLEARVVNGVVSYYVTDMRGSVVAIVDEDGNMTHKYQYDEFGKVVQKEEADYNPFQYVGKYGVMYLNDHQYYMRARHYDPTIGRFLSEDPIWSTNLYPYADNNPVMGIDPMGTTTNDLLYNLYAARTNYNTCLKNHSDTQCRQAYDVDAAMAAYKKAIRDELAAEDACRRGYKKNHGRDYDGVSCVADRAISHNAINATPETTTVQKQYQWPLNPSPNVYPETTNNSTTKTNGGHGVLDYSLANNQLGDLNKLTKYGTYGLEVYEDVGTYSKGVTDYLGDKTTKGLDYLFK